MTDQQTQEQRPDPMYCPACGQGFARSKYTVVEGRTVHRGRCAEAWSEEMRRRRGGRRGGGGLLRSLFG